MVTKRGFIRTCCRAMAAAAVAAAGVLLSGCVKEPFESYIDDGSDEGCGYITVDFSAPALDEVTLTTKASLDYAAENNINNLFVFVFDNAGNKVYNRFFSASTTSTFAIPSIETGEDSITRDERINLLKNEKEVHAATGGDVWWISNSTYENGNYSATKGCFKLRTPKGEGYSIYAIANIDGDFLNISQDYLSGSIKNLSDLKNMSGEDMEESLSVMLLQESVYNNGKIPMSGQVDGVTVNGTDKAGYTGRTEDADGKFVSVSDWKDTGCYSLTLTRLFAKVKFQFESGEDLTFKPTSWQVVNVPKSSYILQNDYDSGFGEGGKSLDEANYAAFAENFFDSPAVNFEDYNESSSSSSSYAFSFYMLENRMTPKATPTSYAQRDLQEKVYASDNSTVIDNKTTTVGDREMRVFKYANDFSTYVVVEGNVEMNNPSDTYNKLGTNDGNFSATGTVMSANVKYLIHLGNWSDDKWSNFKTERNHFYTYTITVNGVNDIRVEVEEETTENEPGAMGEVTIAKETILNCDAHYVSKTIDFHAGSMYNKDGSLNTDNLTWRVSTPFSEGVPTVVGGIDVAEGLDYKWCHFRLNKYTDDNKSDWSAARRKYTPRVYNEYSTWRSAEDNKEDDDTDGRAGYDNDGCMDVIALVAYLKAQAEKYDNYLRYGGENKSDFIAPPGKDVKDKNSAYIRLTAFVDEYYYEEHPLTGIVSPTLWTEFVNQPNRNMHILCSVGVSADGESSAIGSVVTISQKSINCIYNNISSTATTAWGCEWTDETESPLLKSDGTKATTISEVDPVVTRKNAWLYDESDTLSGFSKGNVSSSLTTTEEDSDKRGNNSHSNGRFNTAKEWGLTATTDAKDITVFPKWGDTGHMAFEVDNDTPILKEHYLRYACMTRNRDNNGNGFLDPEEFRWYMASQDQITALFLAKDVLSQDTQIYNRTNEEIAQSDPVFWRQHIITSTSSKQQYSTNPTVIWGEEGVSSSNYTDTYKWLDSYNRDDNNNNYIQSPGRWTVRCVRNLGMTANPTDLSAEPVAVYRKLKEDTKKIGDTEYTVYVIDCSNLNSNCLRYYTSQALASHHERSVENRLYTYFEVIDGSFGRGLYKDINETEDKSLKTSDFCPSGYRLPNQVELTVASLVLGDETDETIDYSNNPEADPNNSITRTDWSLGARANKWGYKMKNDSKYGFIYRAQMNANPDNTPIYRCVRDLKPEEVQ